MNAGACVHMETLYGVNSHHIAEAGFKALARALRTAVEIDPKAGGQAVSDQGRAVILSLHLRERGAE